jgi:hypothetical protein
MVQGYPWTALAKYFARKDAAHAGKKPRPGPEALTAKDAANAFLNAKQALVDAGELFRPNVVPALGGG